MASPSKAEKAKIWLREYLSEFGEYSGTLEELAHLANSTPYLVKKALVELEEETLVKAESKRGKGILVVLVKQEKEKETETQEVESQEVEQKDEKQEAVEKEEKKKKKKEKKLSLQDQVLASLIGKEIIVFLISGTRLEGALLDFDNFTLAMTAPKGKSLVYKHAIATIIFD